MICRPIKTGRVKIRTRHVRPTLGMSKILERFSKNAQYLAMATKFISNITPVTRGFWLLARGEANESRDIEY
jgi:hypothetical protein